MVRRINRVPKEVMEYFIVNYPPESGYTYRFYWYKENKTIPTTPTNKIYGCEVFKNGVFHHNATQGNVYCFREAIG